MKSWNSFSIMTRTRIFKCNKCKHQERVEQSFLKSKPCSNPKDKNCDGVMYQR